MINQSQCVTARGPSELDANEKENSLPGGRRVIGPTILGRHLHAFNYQRFNCPLLVGLQTAPGFLIGKVQPKFGQAAEKNNAGA